MHCYARVKRIRDITADTGMIIDEDTSIHDSRRHIEIMNPSANKTRLIFFEDILIEYGPGSAVLRRLVIDPNTATIAIGAITGERDIVEFGIRPVVDDGASTAVFGEVAGYATVIDPDRRPKPHGHATTRQCFVVLNGY